MMLPPQVMRGPAPRGVCWAWRKGFCARGPDCIYRHAETPHTRSDNRICRWEYATRCHSRGSCGQKHLQLTISGVATRLDYFRSFGRGGKDLTKRDLAELLRVALGLFVDGDQELRFLIISTLSSGWHLEQMKMCLHPNFLFQPYPPQISWQDHVVPLLRIMSDPVNTIHEPSMECLRSLYEVALDPRRHVFWHRVMKFIGDSLKLYPFRVASQITGVVTILLLAIKFDEQNLKNPIVRESVPLLVENLKALQDIYKDGYLSPELSEAVDALKHTVSGRLSVVDALNAVTSKARRDGQTLRPTSKTVVASEAPVNEVFVAQASSKTPVESLEQRLLAFATDKLMAAYLQGLSGHTVNGGLIAGMGFVDIDVDNQPKAETEGLEEELEKIPYSHEHHGDADIQPTLAGLFSIGSNKNVEEPMVFTNDAGDALFQRWKERAADPTKLNFDWGKHSNTSSMKDFLQLTLTLFVAASPETRLQFISEYLLKNEYLGKLWECLNVKLPTDSINHPSPKYSDHVSTIIYIISHPDVVNRREFQAVRKELSGMFASIPNYLYGILEYMKLQSRSKAKNAEMIEACVKSIILILEGVFKLIDPRNISMEFRHEAKAFLKFAISVENSIPWGNRTDSLMTEVVQSFIRADEKLFPESNPPKVCSHRQEDQARDQALIARGVKMANLTTREIDKNVNDRIKSGNIVKPVNSYLDEDKEAVRQDSRRDRSRRLHRRRKNEEEGWDDGKPIIHLSDHCLQDEQADVQDNREEFEKEAQPMNDTEALQYLKRVKLGHDEESVLETEPRAFLNGRAPLGERDLATVNEIDNGRSFDDQRKLQQAMDEEPFRSDGGSFLDESQSVSVKTCPRFPRRGPGPAIQGPIHGGGSDSSGSPPNIGSVLNYMSKFDTSVPLSQTVLQRLNDFQNLVQSTVGEIDSQVSEDGRRAEEPTLTSWNKAYADQTDPWGEAGTEGVQELQKIESWPQSHGSGWSQPEEETGNASKAPALKTSGVRFGPRPRDKATADYYRAIHGTGYPKLHLDSSSKLRVEDTPVSFPRPRADDQNQHEDRKGPERRIDLQEDNTHHGKTSPKHEKHASDKDLAVERNENQASVVEQMVYQSSKEGHIPEYLEGSGRYGSQMTGDRLRELQQTGIKQPIFPNTKEPKTRLTTAPPAGVTPNPGTIPQGGGITGSVILIPDHTRVSLPSRPLATSNKDKVTWPNPQLEAAEAERGRPIARLTNRHDQDFVPRRLSEIRNPDEIRDYLPCGHTRGLNRSETYCNERVSKKTPYCGHEANVECSNPMKRWQCKIVCGAHLSCSHYCRRECYQCLCEIKIDGTAVWNHDPCLVCMNIRAAEERRKNLGGKKEPTNTANVADRAQALE
ncbi:hypothetical protein TWF506_004464 [Arthrobotrys conoides]|uniref:C3H1-type domain-containing protein n=1 Tax=Arthrobotrys conoides TaxID=74498 RepID=A0AAN8NK37_9PEZI